MTRYIDFVSQIPNEVLQKTEKYICRNIALFRPPVYMSGLNVNVTDYHIVIPSGIFPDTLFNNRIVHTDHRRIMVINPGDNVSCVKTVPTRPYYSFLIKSSLLQMVAEEMDFFGEIRFEHIFNPFSCELLQLLKGFERESSRPDRLSLVMDSLEIQIVAMLLREFKTNIREYAPCSTAVDSYIGLATDYIQTFFSSDITIEDICQEIHVSEYHFIRMFKRKLGLSPHRYLLNVRVEKAKELLCTRLYSIAETASFCGFISVPHFSATFKEWTGYTPADYRSHFS